MKRNVTSLFFLSPILMLLERSTGILYNAYENIHFQNRTRKGSLCTTLTRSLLLMIQGAFVDSVDQDQTAQNVQSDL